MWDEKRIQRYLREVRAIPKAVTDPEDVRVILVLEQEFSRLKADATRRLTTAGYSERDIARATGRHIKSVQQWLTTHPETGTPELDEGETDDAVREFED